MQPFLVAVAPPAEVVAHRPGIGRDAGDGLDQLGVGKCLTVAEAIRMGNERDDLQVGDLHGCPSGRAWAPRRRRSAARPSTARPTANGSRVKHTVGSSVLPPPPLPISRASVSAPPITFCTTAATFTAP